MVARSPSAGDKAVRWLIPAGIATMFLALRGVNPRLIRGVYDSTLTDDQQRYSRVMIPIANDIARHLPIHAAVIYAQGALESGWGRSAPQNAYFGAKWGSWSEADAAERARRVTDAVGRRVEPSWPQSFRTHEEYVVGQRTSIEDDFRAYASPFDSAADYAYLVTKTDRYGATTAALSPDPYAQVLGIWMNGYATSSRYFNSVAPIIAKVYDGPIRPTIREISERAAATEPRDRRSLIPDLIRAAGRR